MTSGELEALVAIRVVKDQLRKRNTNRRDSVERRSKAVQAVYDRCAAEERPVPRNDSPDAPHCDHVWSLAAEDLLRLQTAEAWLAELPRLDEVALVTAAENYRLQSFERAGLTGPAKYEAASIEFV
ncbi:MAG TPA: hypothetical protein VF230_00945 [Acidimicrobiales bacterium]